MTFCTSVAYKKIVFTLEAVFKTTFFLLYLILFLQILHFLPTLRGRTWIFAKQINDSKFFMHYVAPICLSHLSLSDPPALKVVEKGGFVSFTGDWIEWHIE